LPCLSAPFESVTDVDLVIGEVVDPRGGSTPNHLTPILDIEELAGPFDALAVSPCSTLEALLACFEGEPSEAVGLRLHLVLEAKAPDVVVGLVSEVTIA
jgi:hypothetical protein